MAEVRMLVRAEITDHRGERFVIEREAVTRTGDNPRFWGDTTQTDLTALVGSVTEHIEHQFGSKPSW